MMRGNTTSKAVVGCRLSVLGWGTGPTTDNRQLTTAFETGSRVDVAAEDIVLGCRIWEQHGALLYLAAPGDARRSPLVREGAPVLLTRSHAGTCLEAEATVCEWVWMKPPILVVGPVAEWRERSRRSSPRISHKLPARLALADGREYLARTRDLSAGGVSLLVEGLPDVAIGAAARLTLRTMEFWCPFVPLRIVRVRHWLRPIGRCVEVGARLEALAAPAERAWQELLARLGSER